MLSGKIKVGGNLSEYLDELREILSPFRLLSAVGSASSQFSGIAPLDPPSASGESLPEIYSWDTDSLLHKFKSPKHQRGFFAALNARRINLPYPRTGGVFRSIFWVLALDSNSLIITAEIPRNVHPGFDMLWLLGDESQQSVYFRDHSFWNPLQEMMMSKLPEIEILVYAAVRQYVLENT